MCAYSASPLTIFFGEVSRVVTIMTAVSLAGRGGYVHTLAIAIARLETTGIMST